MPRIVLQSDEFGDGQDRLENVGRKRLQSVSVEPQFLQRIQWIEETRNDAIELIVRQIEQPQFVQALESVHAEASQLAVAQIEDVQPSTVDERVSFDGIQTAAHVHFFQRIQTLQMPAVQSMRDEGDGSHAQIVQVHQSIETAFVDVHRITDMGA